MAQDTTKEFAFRLGQAVDSHPDAPRAQHGRLTWLLRLLKTNEGVEVSVNTIHKWVHGTSRPREDNIRSLARVLQVDELWLAMGRTPHISATPGAVERAASSASGAALVVAGLIEMNGGKVVFDREGGESVMVVNLANRTFRVCVVAASSSGGQTSFVVPEPTGDSVLLGVVADEGALSVQVLGITEAPRQAFGGFSVVQLVREGAIFADTSGKHRFAPMKLVRDLVPA